jgi:hypothetical protein
MLQQTPVGDDDAAIVGGGGGWEVGKWEEGVEDVEEEEVARGKGEGAAALSAKRTAARGIHFMTTLSFFDFCEL